MSEHAGSSLESRPAHNDIDVMPDETLSEEHARLLRETEALRRDHVALEADRADLGGHRAHRIRLQKQIEALHEHIDRIKREAPDAGAKPK